MARESLTATLAALVLAGCTPPEEYERAFEVPIAATVLQPELGGPFSEPVGFVANGHGGQIVPLALRSGRFLTDDRSVSFLQAPPLATGDDRLLGSVAVHAPSAEEVTLFAADKAFGELLRVPYIVGPELEHPPTVITNDSIDLPAGVEFVEGPTVASGRTTTETWTFAYEDGAFRARGSVSGFQTEPITFDEHWEAADARIGFTLTHDGTTSLDGARFTIGTDNGITPVDVGGTPLAVLTARDQSTVAVIAKAEGASAELLWMDPASEALTAVSLPAGAEPHRMAWAEDGPLLVADAARTAVYVVEQGATKVTEISLPWPVLDVAGLLVEGTPVLYVVPLDGRSLWLLDRDTGAFRDVNPMVPGDQGMPMVVPVSGIEAMLHPYEATEQTEDQIVRHVRAVAIADHGGHMFWAHEATGCLVQDLYGPRTVQQQSSFGAETIDYTRSFEDTAISGPRLERNGSNHGLADQQRNERSVIVNQCAGIAPAERWTLTYDQSVDAWMVEGDLSGVQQGMAREDVRYLSDHAEVSFVIRGGSQPSRDGWRITFTIADGVARAIGNLDGIEGRENALRVPGEPAYFYFREAAPGAIGDPVPGVDWTEHVIRPFLLLPGGATNLVGRVDPQVPPTSVSGDSPEIDVTWD